jgi:hypothetical protein
MPTQQQNLSVRLGPTAECQLAELVAFYNDGSIATITVSDVVRFALNMAHGRLVQGRLAAGPTR